MDEANHKRPREDCGAPDAGDPSPKRQARAAGASAADADADASSSDASPGPAPAAPQQQQQQQQPLAAEEAAAAVAGKDECTVVDEAEPAKRREVEERAEAAAPLSLDRFRGLTSVHQELLCPICHGIAREPLVHGDEATLFCRVCIESWLAKEASCSSAAKCPTCSAEITLASLHQPSRVVQNIIDRLEIRCPNSSRGCQEYVALGRLSVHEGECPHAAVTCENQGCGATMDRREMAAHSAACPHRLQPCRLCGSDVKACAVAEHEARSCPLVTERCACGALVARRDRAAHEAEACPEALVPCTIGCEAGTTYRRRDTDEHMQACASRHVAFLLAELSAARHSAADAQAALAAVAEQTTKLAAEVRELRAATASVPEVAWRIVNFKGRLHSLWRSQARPKLESPVMAAPSGHHFSVLLYPCGDSLDNAANVALYFVVLPQPASSAGSRASLSSASANAALAPFSCRVRLRVGTMSRELDPETDPETRKVFGECKTGRGWRQFISTEEAEAQCDAAGTLSVCIHIGPQVTFS
eukprot:m51a1_g435 putative tnf receptor-associated factor 4 (532) ;mRNA; f:62405-64286